MRKYVESSMGHATPFGINTKLPSVNTAEFSAAKKLSLGGTTLPIYFCTNSGMVPHRLADRAENHPGLGQATSRNVVATETLSNTASTAILLLLHAGQNRPLPQRNAQVSRKSAAIPDQLHPATAVPPSSAVPHNNAHPDNRSADNAQHRPMWLLHRLPSGERRAAAIATATSGSCLRAEIRRTVSSVQALRRHIHFNVGDEKPHL
jgi:hypothetical protein